MMKITNIKLKISQNSPCIELDSIHGLLKQKFIQSSFTCIQKQHNNMYVDIVKHNNMYVIKEYYYFTITDNQDDNQLLSYRITYHLSWKSLITYITNKYITNQTIDVDNGINTNILLNNKPPYVELLLSTGMVSATYVYVKNNQSVKTIKQLIELAQLHINSQ